MKKYFIVKIDIGSKQKYIFSSNRLKEIIGASSIIKFVTEELGKKVIENIDGIAEVFDGENNGNILFEAGGNAMYIFNNLDQAKKFNRIFSKFVIQSFDGLELLMVLEEFDIENKPISELYTIIEDKLTLKKGKSKSQFRRISYGLTKLCTSTRKPSVQYKKEHATVRYYSKEAKDKLDFFESRYKESNYTYPRNQKSNFEIKIEKDDIKSVIINECGELITDKFKELLEKFNFTDELDKIAGEINKGSYIGITCADGNGMGKKIDSFNENFKKEFKSRKNIFEFNKEYIKRFNALTKEIKVKYIWAFAQTIEKIMKNYDKYCEEIDFKLEDKIIPIRPIILAGDDITFISNGKIAIEATKIFTEIITQKSIDFGGGNKHHLTISAGVAIVKRNHPFFRAVKLAGQLENNSKKRLKEIQNAFSKLEKNKNYYYDTSLIDWHIDRGNSLEELSAIRSKPLIDIENKNIIDNSFEISNKQLVARPYIVEVKEKEGKEVYINLNDEQLKLLKVIIGFKFEHFSEVIKIIKNSDIKSNCNKYFRAMNTGEVETQLYSMKYDIKKKINSDLDVDILNQVVYDSIETLDLYTNLEGEN